MNRLFILFVMPILFSAGCLGFDFGGLSSQFNIGEPSYTLTESLGIDTETIPAEVDSGRNVTIYFDVENKGNTTLKNLDFRTTDTCVFSPSEKNKNIDKLEAGELENWKWKFESSEVKEDRTCAFRYMASYDSKSLATYDISTISEEEFMKKRERGELEKNIKLEYLKTKSPVEINMEISSDQPVLAGEEFYFYTYLVNKGNGIAKNQMIKKGNLVINYPGFIEVENCDDFKLEGNKLILDKNLDFIEGKTKKSTCKMKAKNVNILKTGKFVVSVNFSYIIDKKIEIPLKS